MPDLMSIRRLSLADLDQKTLEELVRHGESLLVERKRELPPVPRFGAAAGSFANTLGGWLLLGVADDGTVHGWEPPGGSDIQSHLGAVLRAQVDPLPPFVAAMREVEGKPVGVVRVFESADAPHIVRGTGAVHLRSSKGKEPVDDHRTLLALAARGEMAEQVAAGRLTDPRGSVAGVMDTSSDLPKQARFLVQAAPLTVTPALAEWPLTRAAAEAGADAVRSSLRSRSPHGAKQPSVDPRGETTIVTATQHSDVAVTTVSTIANTRGLLAVERTYRTGRPQRVAVQTMLDQDIRPLAHALITLLTSAEAIGRALVDFWILLPLDGQVVGGERELPRLNARGEITISASHDEVDALAARWHRGLQRQLGVINYERKD